MGGRNAGFSSLAYPAARPKSRRNPL